MTILSIMRDTANNSSNMTIVRMITTSPIEDVISEGWFANQYADFAALNGGGFTFDISDVFCVRYGSQIGDPHAQIFLQFTRDMNSLMPIDRIYPNNTGVTAHAGGGQTNATILKIGTNSVTTVATNGDSVKLPNDVLGQTTVVFNNSGHTLAIFPYEGDEIDQLGVNASLPIGAGTRRVFIGTGINNWWALD